MKKIALVLEGGGLRGAYTCGCISWLLDNNIDFYSGYGISTGAWHLCGYLNGNASLMKELSTKYINNKKYMGVSSFLSTGGIFNFKAFLNDFVNNTSFSLDKLKDSKVKAKIGLYNLKEGKTLYYDANKITLDHLVAACSLPIISKVVEINGDKFLDGGITKMIPIEQALEDKNDGFLVITTKPRDFIRKPSKGFVVSVMKNVYKKYPSIGNDYAVRDKNYYNQINLIKDLENKGKAIYRYPSKPSNVTRLKGTYEELCELYELGRSDMEEIKDKIFDLCK